MLRILGFALACLFATAPACADCDHFRWPLAREKAWFAASPEPIDAGAESAAPEQAYAVTLKPTDAAGYLLPLTKPAPAGSYGGVIKFASFAKAGLYQVTLSREGWIDVIQNNARAKTRNVSRQRDCPNMRKSVRFQLSAGPAVVQISGVDQASIAIAVATAN